MENNLQTHTIPADRKACERLAVLMGFKKLNAFEAACEQHTCQVRQAYDQLLKAETPETPPGFPQTFTGTEAEWKQILAAHTFKDVEKSLRLLHQFANGPGYVHVSPRTVELAWQLIPKLLALCPKISAPQTAKSPIANRQSPTSQHLTRPALSDPDRVLARLDSFIAAYGARATLLETWTHNPHLFELLLLLFDRSEFLAEIAIRTPDLVDELVLSGRLRRRKSAEEILRELRHGLEDKDQHLWLRRYHQAELMRI